VDTLHQAGLTALIFVAALLYSSVGHAGASGYLAAMALFGVAPDVMKPAALALNILVALIGTAKFARAGCFVWRVFWPFALVSVPCAFAGGRVHVPGHIYKPLVGVVLLFAAWRLWPRRAKPAVEAPPPPPVPLALGAGAGIGFLSGLTGVGGGIFLSPLLLLLRWAGARETAGVSVAFILVNSLSGMAGQLKQGVSLPSGIGWWAAAVAVGGGLGSHVGSRKLAPAGLRRMLAVVLVIAGSMLVQDGVKWLAARWKRTVNPPEQGRYFAPQALRNSISA